MIKMGNKIKIVYCIPSLCNSGGMERVLTLKVNYLISFYDITIITTEQKDKLPFFPLNPNVKLINWEFNFNDHFNYSLFRKIKIHFKKLHQYKKMLEQYLKENNIDICVSLCGKEIDFLPSLRDGSTKIAELHFTKNIRKLFIAARKKGIFWQFIANYRNWQLERNTKKISKLIVLSENELLLWKKVNRNVVCIPNPSPLTDIGKSNVLAKRAIAVGHLNLEKGFEFLIDAWAIVNKKHPDWSVDIYGDGELRCMLSNKIKTFHLESVVHLKGVTRNIQDEYLSSSLLIMTSRYEGLPMVLIEAMTCGLPLISFDCECGPRSIISNGNNGFLVEVGDVYELADKISYLIENENIRERMSQKSKELSVKYSRDIIMGQWIDLFESLIKK